MAGTRVLSVGQCGYDSGRIKSHMRRSFNAETIAAPTAAAALRTLAEGRVDLILVNRVGDADGAPGLDLIRTLKADPALAEIPVMLVSNYAWAQDEAVQAGALPGFGKEDLGTPALDAALRAVLDPQPAP